MIFWQDLWEALILEILASLVVAILSAIIRALWARVRGGQNPARGALPGLDWTEWGFFVLMLMALSGSVLLSVGAIVRLFPTASSSHWTLWQLMLSWLGYLASSLVLTWLGLQIFLAYQTGGRLVSASFRSVRLRRLAVCQLAKIAAMIFLTGFAAIGSRFDSSGMLSLSFVLLVGMDALGLLIILFAD